jgi:hypothetical protein
MEDVLKEGLNSLKVQNKFDKFKEKFTNLLGDIDTTDTVNLDDKNFFDYIKKIFSNIFLLIISILKSLSSNYMPILILAIAIFCVISFLSKRIITLPCTGCSNGSWWYKCMRKTGFGSRTCKTYNFLTDTAFEVYNMIINGPVKLYTIIIELINHKILIIKRYIKFIDDYSVVILNLLPQFIILKILFVLKPLNKVFKKLTAFLADFKCPFTLPIINEEIDVCAAAKTALATMLGLVKTLFNLVITIFKIIFITIYNAIIKPIFNNITTYINESTKIITISLENIFTGFTKVIEAIKAPVDIILQIKIVQYFILILDYIINFLLDKIKIFAIFGSAAPTITLMLALLIMFIIIFIPICGGLLSFFSIIKAIVYIILNCDDDDDFLFLILKIINYIFGKNFGESN